MDWTSFYKLQRLWGLGVTAKWTRNSSSSDIKYIRKLWYSKLGFGSAEYIHLFTEAKKVVYEDRAKYYADQNFSNVPVGELSQKNMLNQNEINRFKKCFKKF